LKIVHIGPVHPFRGGISHHVSALTKEFSKNHTVDVISFKDQYPSWLYPGKSDRDPSQDYLYTKADFQLAPFNPLTWSKTLRLIRKKTPDFVLFHWWVTTWAFAYRYLASRIRSLGIPVLFMVHNTLPHETHVWDKVITKIALSKGDAFILHNETQEQKLKMLYPGAKTVICPHPVYNFSKLTKLSRSDARSRLNLPLDLPIVLFFGIVRPYKSLSTLIEALSILSRRGINVFLLIAGEFWEEPYKYQEQINKHGLSSRVHIDNRYVPNEELVNYFTAANLFVAPYSLGTQSGSLALALGFGLPIIATDHILRGNKIPDGAVIASIPPSDPLALAGEIEKLLNQADLLWKKPVHNIGNWSELVQSIEAALLKAKEEN